MGKSVEIDSVDALSSKYLGILYSWYTFPYYKTKDPYMGTQDKSKNERLR